MKITGDHYLILWGLFHAGQFATESEITWRAHIDLKIVVRCLWHMTQRAFCDGDPWLDVRRRSGINRWFITGRRGVGDETTGGWRALEDSATNPVIIQASERSWRDEALTGITPAGKPSAINNAALVRR
jgi:hypothetical protein